MDENRDSADRHPRNRHVIRWAAGAAAVAVLAGGGAALASSGGSAGPAPTSQASALDAVLSSADAPTSAELAAASPGGATTSPATTSPAAPAPGATGPGAAGAARRCARAAAALKGTGHPRLARRAVVACRGRLGRLRLLIRGEHGQVTVRAKGGTTRTLAFERGKVTAVSGTAVTVAAADGTTWTWHLVADSVVRQGGQKVSASRLAAGQQVFAGGPVVNGTDDARLIVIRPPVPAGAAAPSTAPAGS
jgi:ABC-type transport system substrate-binding protein